MVLPPLPFTAPPAPIPTETLDGTSMARIHMRLYPPPPPPAPGVELLPPAPPAHASTSTIVLSLSPVGLFQVPVAVICQ